MGVAKELKAEAFEKRDPSRIIGSPALAEMVLNCGLISDDAVGAFVQSAVVGVLENGD